MINEIKKELDNNNLIIGYEEVKKAIAQNKVSKVFYASNIEENKKQELEKYTKIASITLEDAKLPNDEMGIICKKSFSISVLAVKK